MVAVWKCVGFFPSIAASVRILNPAETVDSSTPSAERNPAETATVHNPIPTSKKQRTKEHRRQQRHPHHPQPTTTLDSTAFPRHRNAPLDTLTAI